MYDYIERNYQPLRDYVEQQNDYDAQKEPNRIAAMAEHQDEFRAQDNEEQLLFVLFDVPAEGMGEFLTTAQISQKLIDFGSIKRPMPLNRLGMILAQQGYKCVRQGPSRQRGWLVYQRTMDEIKTDAQFFARQQTT